MMWVWRERDLVIGPKYPSLDEISVGVGEGEMTLGVAGMGECEEAMTHATPPDGQGWRRLRVDVGSEVRYRRRRRRGGSGREYTVC